MRRALVLLIFFSLSPAALYAADDAVAKAMKLYEKRHYNEAAAMLRTELSSLERGRQAATQQALGMIYLKNAELHRAFHHAALVTQLDYLQKLAGSQGKNRSRFVDLYLGETLIEAGKPEQALTYIEKFLADDTVSPRYKAAAKVDLGLCYALRNLTLKADETWSGLERTDPEVKASLADAFIKAGLRDRKPASLADESLVDLKKSAGAPTIRQVKNLVAVYAVTGFADKGLDITRRADLKAFSYKESLSKTKVINFYDPSLLADLSSLYLQAGIAALEKAAQDIKLKETANFYLGRAYSLAGHNDQSMRATASFIASSSMPQQYRDKATVLQAANQYQKGRQFDAIAKWDELSRKQPQDPDILAEILFTCGRLHIDCPTVANKSEVLVETGEGRRLANLNIGLGNYYLMKKNYAKAISYLEAGRDKGNKNKIESNDPLMLVDLAEAYYRTKKFSEALEIYFEMSKQFPEVRQIQESLQGIYAMEHKSAGDVKIY